MSDWQTIDTAPKDGTEILVLFDGNLMDVAHWDKYEGWIVACDPFYGVSPITHWMPLPKAPE